jgi:hypothetical protein
MWHVMGDRRFIRGIGEGNHLEDLGTDGRILLRWIFKKWDRETRIGPIWLRIRTGGGSL